MNIHLVKLLLIAVTLIFSTFLLRRYRHIPSVTLTLICFIAFQTIITQWYDFLFLFGVSFILIGINMEYVKLYKKYEQIKGSHET